MIRHKQDMQLEVRKEMRGGTGEVSLLEIVSKDEMRHCRLFSEITIPPGGSIGPHVHEGETEYYFIISGTGMVGEADGDKAVSPGDVVITGSGAGHSIANTGDEPLVFLAVIILDD